MVFEDKGSKDVGINADIDVDPDVISSCLGPLKQHQPQSGLTRYPFVVPRTPLTGPRLALYSSGVCGRVHVRRLG
jgi:hypothetical protein